MSETWNLPYNWGFYFLDNHTRIDFNGGLTKGKKRITRMELVFELCRCADIGTHSDSHPTVVGDFAKNQHPKAFFRVLKIEVT